MRKQRDAALHTAELRSEWVALNSLCSHVSGLYYNNTACSVKLLDV